MPSEKHLNHIGGISAIFGVFVLVVGTMLHPMDAPPSDAVAAFSEYSRDKFWVASHLAQCFGVVLIAAGMIALSWKLRGGRAGAWALLAGVTVVVSVSLAGALQAVHGVALKFAVDRWSVSTEVARTAAFETAYAVRQIEIGLASLMEIFFGLAILLYGISLMLSAVAPRWLGIFGCLAGVATIVSGVIKAHTGFSDVAMAISMPSSLLALTWSLCVAVFLLRGSSVRTMLPNKPIEPTR
jgi:Domain of unknown function (DUF4386)